MRLSVDSNILVYCVDAGDARQAAALVIVEAVARADGVLTLQALGKFFHAVTRKRKVAAADAVAMVARWQALFGKPVAASPACLPLAMEARALDRFQFWDAMLLATAGAAGCDAVISEDMAHGATLGPVRVVRAFDVNAVSPEAAALLDRGPP